MQLFKSLFCKNLTLHNLTGKQFCVTQLDFFTFTNVMSDVVKIEEPIYKVFLGLKHGTLIVLLDEQNFTKLKEYSELNNITFKHLENADCV